MASAALALGIVLGGSGCAMLTYQATTEPYDASDGVSADVGELELRNILVISDLGVAGNLVMTVVNNGAEDRELLVEYGDGGEAEPVEIAAGSTVSFGVGEEQGVDPIKPVLLPTLDAQPGSLLPIFFQYEGAEGMEVRVPVLNGTLPEYSSLVPKPGEVLKQAAKDAVKDAVETAVPTATPAPTAEPTETPAAQ
ncbi:hypothetical protein ACWKWP_05235 [Agromyces soli]